MTLEELLASYRLPSFRPQGRALSPFHAVVFVSVRLAYAAGLSLEELGRHELARRWLVIGSGRGACPAVGLWTAGGVFVNAQNAHLPRGGYLVEHLQTRQQWARLVMFDGPGAVAVTWVD